MNRRKGLSVCDIVAEGDTEAKRSRAIETTSNFRKRSNVTDIRNKQKIGSFLLCYGSYETLGT